MRSWYPILPCELDNKRLLGEHLELHTMFSVIKNNKKGYSRHPETLRWKEHLPALIKRHDDIVVEMKIRGFKHLSPINKTIDRYEDIVWPDTIEPLEVMKDKLNNKQKSLHTRPF